MKQDNDDYIEVNRLAWNKKLDIHIESEFYDLDGFVSGNDSLNSIELDLLGDISNKSILHLQCHFGQDSMSMSRRGAKVTGMDLSDKSIAFAKDLASRLSLDTRFVCCDLYELPKHLDGTFDIVFTSYGTIGWLPDLNKWAEVISKFMHKGSRFVMAEFHPFVWMYDDNFENVSYNYFKDEPIIESSTSYADKEAVISHKRISWNHCLSETIGSLLENDLELLQFKEYDYSPYDCLNDMIKIDERKYRIKKFGNKLPLVYALEMIKSL